MFIATRTPMTSFSKKGLPRVSSGGVSSCVKLNSTSSMRPPRRRSKCITLTLTPTKNRPLPSVWARSPKIGPPDVAVFTGNPPTNWYVTPLEVEPTGVLDTLAANELDRKSTRLNSSHLGISYAVFCLKKKKQQQNRRRRR